MADGSTRAIEEIKPGDSVRASAKADGILTSQFVLRNHTARVSSTVLLTMADGSTLETSLRQPLILHNGATLRAVDLARWMQRADTGVRSSPEPETRKVRFVPADDLVRPARLQTNGNPVEVVSSRIISVPRTVHWLETKEKQPFFVAKHQFRLPIVKTFL